MKTIKPFLSLIAVAIVSVGICMLSSCGKDEPQESVVQGANNSQSEDPDLVPPTNGDSDALPGLFSVAEGKQVRFAKGNLQYTTTGTHVCKDGSTKKGTWRFAEHQYDCIGSDNKNIGSDYSGWIDLFGWGTSGYNGYNPYSSSYFSQDYCSSADIAGTNYDWGVYNAISNGGNKAGKWRTLTYAEWDYLWECRTNASSKRGQAMVNEVPGVVFLPDSWTLPASCSFVSSADNGWTINSYTTTQWAAMEEAGALFLPAAGYRDGTKVSDVANYGLYWSSTAYDYVYVHNLSFLSESLVVGIFPRYYGQSVRLVCE